LKGGASAPRWLARWRRRDYRDVTAGLIFGKQAHRRAIRRAANTVIGLIVRGRPAI